MIERKKDIKIEDYMNAILEHHKRTSKDSSVKEYSIDIRRNNFIEQYSIEAISNNSMDMAYCRVFVRDGVIINKEYYYLDFADNGKYNFISNESIFMKFFNENDDVFWRLIN